MEVLRLIKRFESKLNSSVYTFYSLNYRLDFGRAHFSQLTACTVLLRILLHLKIVCPEKKEKKVEGDKEFHTTAKTIRVSESLSYSVM